MTSRRRFIQWIPVAGAAGLGLRAAVAQTQPAPMLSESEPQAVALGYVADASRVDKTKFPKYTPPQRCAVCALYQAPSTVQAAPCTLFPGKLVAGPGWCSAYVPKTT